MRPYRISTILVFLLLATMAILFLWKTSHAAVTCTSTEARCQRSQTNSGVLFNDLINAGKIPQQDGTSTYCSNCGLNSDGTCNGTGVPVGGEMATRLGGIWICGSGGGGGGPLPTPTPYMSDCDIEVTTQPGADICDKFNAAVATAFTKNMQVICWHGSQNPYINPSTQCQVPSLATQTQSNISANFQIRGHGVILQPTGSQTAGIKINFQGNQSKLTISGIRVMAQNNPNLLAAFDIGYAYHLWLEDTGFLYGGNGINPNFAAYHIGPGTPGSTLTFSQDVHIDHALVNVYGGMTPSVGPTIPVALWIEGQSSNIYIQHNGFYNAQHLIRLSDDRAVADSGDPANPTPGWGLSPGETNISFNDIEGAAYSAIEPYMYHQPAFPWGGVWNISTNDFDHVNVVWDLTHANPLGWVNAPMFDHNMLVADNVQFMKNPLNVPNAYSSMDYQQGVAGWSGRQLKQGFNIDALSLQAGSQQGILGSAQMTALDPPKVRVLPGLAGECNSFCSAANVPYPCCTGFQAGTCTDACTTTYCYQAKRVDFKGDISGLGPIDCVPYGPATLSPTTPLTVSEENGSPVIGTCGWQIFGRQQASMGALNPGGKFCGNTPVTLLHSDQAWPTPVTPGQVTNLPTGTAPQLLDTGVLTAGAAPTAGAATSGMFYPGIAGFATLPSPQAPFASLPTLLSSMKVLDDGTLPGAIWPMAELSGTLADVSGHANTATPTVGGGTITYNVQPGLVRDEPGGAIGFSGTGNPYFSVAPNASLPSGNTWCVAGAFQRAAGIIPGSAAIISQKVNGFTVEIDPAIQQMAVIQNGGLTLTSSIGGYNDTNAHFFTVSDIAKTITEYVDGNDVTQPVNSGSAGAPPNLAPADTTLYFGIGGSANNFDFKGNIGNLYANTTGCSPASAKALYKAWVRKKDGMLAYDTTNNCEAAHISGLWKCLLNAP